MKIDSILIIWQKIVCIKQQGGKWGFPLFHLLVFKIIIQTRENLDDLMAVRPHYDHTHVYFHTNFNPFVSDKTYWVENMVCHANVFI